MLQRRQLAGLLGTAAASSLLPAEASAGVGLSTLFTIARSKNKNIVRYAARRVGQTLDLARPIEAHWLMLAEDGRREELSWAERKLAYGFSASKISPEGCRLELAAFRARPVSVERRGQDFRALVLIARRRAVLERIFVRASEGALLPSVEHIDLYGMSLDGAPLSERIVAR